MIVIARAVAAFLGVALLFSFGPPAFAQNAAPTITGQVFDRRNALPVTGATVVEIGKNSASNIISFTGVTSAH
jgi:hypothetical protein